MKTKTPLQEGHALADRYMEEWDKAPPDQDDWIDNDIVEYRTSEKVVSLLLCTGGPHLELAIVFNSEDLLFGVWTYKDWGTCDRWVASQKDMETIGKHFSSLPEIYA